MTKTRIDARTDKALFNINNNRVKKNELKGDKFRVWFEHEFNITPLADVVL